MASIQIRREWDQRFGFLARFQLEDLFLFILGLAQSVRDLNQLHGLLRANCRLLRPELMSLEGYWRAFFDEEAPQGGTRLSNQVVSELLELLYNRHERQGVTAPWLTRYYLEKLDEGRAVGDTLFRESKYQRVVFPSQGRLGHGQEHFLVKLFGHEMRMRCVFTSGHPLEMGVRISTWSYLLTEPLTHQLLGLPESGIGHRMGNSKLGEEVDFWYTLPGKPFQEHCRSQVVSADEEPIWISEVGFLPALSRALKERGLPVKDISSIIGDRNVFQT